MTDPRHNPTKDDCYDPLNHRATDRRPIVPWVVKYWQMIIAGVLLTAGAATFYYSSIAVAKDVMVLTASQKNFVTKEALFLEHLLIDEKLGNLSEKITNNEGRAIAEFDKLSEKLDEILSHLIKHSPLPN